MEIFIYTLWVRMDYRFKIHNPWILKRKWNGLPKSIIHMDSGFYGMDMDLGS